MESTGCRGRGFGYKGEDADELSVAVSDNWIHQQEVDDEHIRGANSLLAFMLTLSPSLSISRSSHE
jgi:hypothetical protein